MGGNQEWARTDDGFRADATSDQPWAASSSLVPREGTWLGHRHDLCLEQQSLSETPKAGVQS